MYTKTIPLHSENFESTALVSVEALRCGKLIVFPTETVYGMSVLPSVDGAVERLCKEKERKAGHALPLAVSDWNMLVQIVPTANWIARTFALQFWPGPLTLVLEVPQFGGILSELSEFALHAIKPSTTVGVRAPQHPFLLNVLSQLNEPIVLTSANISGKAPATTGIEVLNSLGTRPDLVIDDGPVKIGLPSTVVQVFDSTFKILRAGSISEKQLEDVLNSKANTSCFTC